MERTGSVHPILPDFDPDAFFRLLAKIAHSFAVAEMLSGRRPEVASRRITWLLPDMILGRDKDYGRLIGGFKEEGPPAGDEFHKLQFGETRILRRYAEEPERTPWEDISIGVAVYIRLFDWLGAPEYGVTVARFTDLPPDLELPDHLRGLYAV